MAETSPCPRCGAVGSGNFCSTCGASRGTATCPACGHESEPGARFCTRCGTPLPGRGAPAAAPGVPASPASESGGAARGGGNLGWWAAGLVLVALILFAAYPVVRGSDAAGPPATGGGAAGAGSPAARASPDVLSMDPREAADRLYDRVMRAAAAGDSTEVTMFLPMSIAAYDRARPLDADGLYHLSVLQRTAGDEAAALATAREALDDSPRHLLALGAAAEAAGAVGHEAAARELWERFLAAYDAEMAAGREEYTSHALSLDGFLERARAFTGGG
ncbi:MAG: zinc ribbon domain-containing protein [Gemmatimonadetes bacterium]|nr:zinc ribbon domain-containing protein [Gemmatimonadota bacterium]